MKVIRFASAHPAFALAIALTASLISQPALSAGVEEFYKGRTISLVIGYSVGGGYDLYARLLARHMGQYIPGHPTIVPQNLTGQAACGQPASSIPLLRRTAACSARSAAPSPPLRC